ncbi:MAG TPA: hypothetical protein VK206_06170, partial [Anaerolineales bacterium]|nr:hypothetical protein [Anaerolineales bacterium]
MANTRKPKEDDEEKIVKENIQKRFKNMFSGKGQPLSNLSIQEVEALKDRIFQLEKELAQESNAQQAAVIQKRDSQPHVDTLVKEQPSRLT